MTQIINGELVYNELTQNSNGGTELMARRMVENISPDLLEGKQIIFSRVRDLEPNLKKILYVHDLATDPEVSKLADPEFRAQFEKIVFVSNWQQHTYNMVLGVPFSQSHVITNAIPPINYIPRASFEDRAVKLIYHTTPHRGLRLLVPAVKYLRDNGFNIELDVYSSFKVYGWEERDKEYQDLFEVIDQTEGMVNHGFVPNVEIRDALTKADIFAYPNIWPETSCLALIEAMCAGCLCIHSNLGALPETSLNTTTQYMFSENSNDHVNHFVKVLASIVNPIRGLNIEQYNEIQSQQSWVANRIYNITRYKMQWEELLRSV